MRLNGYEYGVMGYMGLINDDYTVMDTNDD